MTCINKKNRHFSGHELNGTKIDRKGLKSARFLNDTGRESSGGEMM